ncbi:MAG: Ppx/GppA family phosphatase [Reichenbachiella sp.]
MRKGIIDIGTNTFHLLVVDTNNDYSVLHKEKVAVRIGENGISEGNIAEAAIVRAINTLHEFKAKMDALKVDDITATATSAVRSASNQQEFLSRTKAETGIKINVLSGEDEAFLIHKGVIQYTSIDKTALIIDIGGGSIEFIIADNEEIKWLKSYEIGGQRLIDQFHKSDPISNNEIDHLTQFLENELSDMLLKAEEFDAQYLIGSSGSFDTFWDIHAQKSQNTDNSDMTLDENDFDIIHRELINANKEERLMIPGMIPMRVDMIVGASIVTKTILDKLQFKKIKVSPFALKEGVLYHGLPAKK